MFQTSCNYNDLDINIIIILWKMILWNSAYSSQNSWNVGDLLQNVFPSVKSAKLSFVLCIFRKWCRRLETTTYKFQDWCKDSNVELDKTRKCYLSEFIKPKTSLGKILKSGPERTHTGTHIQSTQCVRRCCGNDKMYKDCKSSKGERTGKCCCRRQI